MKKVSFLIKKIIKKNLCHCEEVARSNPKNNDYFEKSIKKLPILKKIIKKFMKNKKIAILHDYFLYSWGWERLVSLLAKGLDADIYTWFINKDSLDPKDIWFKNKFKALTKPLLKQGFRQIKMMSIFSFKTKFLEKYETIIFSWNCTEASKNTPNSKKIYYCHSPTRYLYDKYEHHLKQKKWIKKILFKILIPFLRKKYENNLKNFDEIITNSKTVQERLKKYTGYNSTVVYPPVDTNNFLAWKSEWFFLSYARITDIKRVDFIAKAFKKISDEKLVIIFNPSDPFLEEVKKVANWAKNIKFVEAKWKEIPNWVAKSRATIYIPQDEDFWMSPIESMSAWKPCIWVNEWWLRETIIDWKTWILLKKDFEIDDICKAVKNLSEKKCEEMKENCIKRAKEFDLEIFIKWMKKVINKVEKKYVEKS